MTYSLSMNIISGALLLGYSVVIPPYDSMGGYLVYCVFACLFVFLFILLRISQWRKKLGGMKFCMRVGLLSGQVFSPFGEDWLVGSHGGSGITSR